MVVVTASSPLGSRSAEGRLRGLGDGVVLAAQAGQALASGRIATEHPSAHSGGGQWLRTARLETRLWLRA